MVTAEWRLDLGSHVGTPDDCPRSPERLAVASPTCGVRLQSRWCTLDVEGEKSLLTPDRYPAFAGMLVITIERIRIAAPARQNFEWALGAFERPTQ